MFSHADTAKYVSDLMLDIPGRLDESVGIIKSSCTPEEEAAYRRSVGRILGRILLDVLNPLYAEHPSLKPQGFE
jgi:hypothetical protein